MQGSHPNQILPGRRLPGHPGIHTLGQDAWRRETVKALEAGSKIEKSWTNKQLV
jgi:hypothetical protein